MSRISGTLKSNILYAFIVVGVVWGIVAFNTGSLFVLWPVVTCFLSALLLRLRPGERLTWAWVTATAVLGFLLSGYQAYVAAFLVGGALSSVASLSLAGFLAFALVHLVLLYAGASPGPK